MPNNKKHWPLLNIEYVGDGHFMDDKEVFLGSIAISLKRIADTLTGNETHMAPLEYLAEVIERVGAR